MKEETILLCGECLEGAVNYDNLCNMCGCVECTYYELTEYEYEEIENLDHAGRVSYLKIYNTYNLPRRL